MQRKLLSQLGIFILGMSLLLGCTPYMKGSRQLDRGNYEAAIESLQEELAQNPDNWRARQRLGFAYLKTGRLDQSISEFKIVVGQRPPTYPPTTAFSFAARQTKGVPGQNPRDPLSTYYLGQAYLQNGQGAQAIETWRSYRNWKAPLVEQEIKKQLTLVEISESIRLAKQALAEEEKLETIPPQPGTVAVFYFKDTSPDQSFRHLQKAMATMIITDLSQVGALQVLERFRVQFLLAEMQLGQTGIVEETTAPRYGHLLGAENLIVGTMEPGSLRVKTSVASTSKKDVVGSIAVGSKIEEFYILQKEIVYNILKLLRVKFNSLEEMKFSQYHTKNLKAVTYFGQGLEALDVGNWREARQFFDRAVKEDPSFKLAVLYRNATPSATAPSLAAIDGMTDTEISDQAEHSVSRAMALQTTISTDPNDPDDAKGSEETTEEPAGTGSVSFSW